MQCPVCDHPDMIQIETNGHWCKRCGTIAGAAGAVTLLEPFVVTRLREIVIDFKDYSKGFGVEEYEP